MVIDSTCDFISFVCTEDIKLHIDVHGSINDNYNYNVYTRERLINNCRENKTCQYTYLYVVLYLA